MSLKKYQSFKTVTAGKIEKISRASTEHEGAEKQIWHLHFQESSDNSLIGDEIQVSQKWFEKHQPLVGGYFVKYEDGYQSYSPALAFESGYRLMYEPSSKIKSLDLGFDVSAMVGTVEERKLLTFGQALEEMKLGNKVQRSFWPISDFLYIVKGSNFKVNRPPLDEFYPEGTEIHYSAHIDKHVYNEETGTHHCLVWSATNEDYLFNDWQVVGDKLD